MKTAEASFHFPVLGFTPDREIWGFQDLNTLTSCGPRTLKESMQSDMELVDADGRRWIVRSIRPVGRATSWLKWALDSLISTPQTRIEHELDVLDPIGLKEVQARTCASVEAFPQDFGVYEDGEADLKALLDSIRATATIAAIHDLLGLDSFMAY